MYNCCIFSLHEKEIYIRIMLKKQCNIVSCILWDYEYAKTEKKDMYISSSANEEIKRLESRNTVFIVGDNKEAEYLIDLGISSDRIYTVYSKNFKWSMFRYVLLQRWFFTFFASHIHIQKIKIFLELRLLDYIYKYIKHHDIRFAIVGAGKYSDYLTNKCCKDTLFVGRYVIPGEEGPGKPIEELLYENVDDVKIFMMHLNMMRKTEEYLFELGFQFVDVFLIGDTRCNAGSGSASLDAYDIRLGYTRIVDGIPGYIVFESNENDENQKPYTILCLGGSTSDPTTANIRSWSEILFDMMEKRGVNVKVWAGGVSAYVVEQEMDKFIRDGFSIKPDLVLSYSGINNSQGLYNVDKHPMVRKYQESIFNELIGNGLDNRIQFGIPIKCMTLGLEDYSSKAESWINAERVIQGICEEFNISFHAFLQPYYQLGDNYTDHSDLREIEDFYFTAKNLIQEQNRIHDFTNIFDNEKNVFFDVCHTYEKGNEIIAKNMLPIVLNEYKDWRNKR